MNRVVNIVTGPSGSGKSAFCRRQEDWSHVIYNLDDLARSVGDPDDPSVRANAWRRLSGRFLDNLNKGASPLVLDHVADSTIADEIVIPARMLDYQIRLWVVCPENTAICVTRVSLRKSEGGHGASADTIRTLYLDALEVASELSIIADRTTFVDSTSEFVVIGCIKNFEFRQLSDHIPLWVQEHFLKNSV